MTPPSDQVEAIVDAALDLAPAERASYLDRVCGDNTSLRQTVEALLRAHQHAPVPGIPATPAPAATLSEQPSDHIGIYKLLQRIGEGGCGVVYLAEQEEPIRRQVALKVIKLGMDTRQVIARFEAERQALALMDHPNIAKVLDAGASEAGRPFFVMELVRGIKITDYCDQNHLPTSERLELFSQVCNAVQHAHQKGVIHRDIKPSNILVTVHDGVPVPKVIDFGIAKATEQRLTDKTILTAFEQFIGTPAYMSPEQAEMSGQDIDTRSDIYSLGVLLYELLTGLIPFDRQDLAEAGLDQMRRIIREKDPVRPSLKLNSLSAADQTTVARKRQVEAPRLVHLVRGDLDWIVMKCLEKDRTRRYETVNGLAQDIKRHLGNEPVTACPPSRWYRVNKLIRRNKLFFAAAGAVTASLILGLGIATLLYLREAQARQLARSEARKSEQSARFFTDMLNGVGPSVALGRDTTLLREILDRTAARVAEELKDQPELEANLLNTIGEVYRALEDHGKAESIHRHALAIRTRLWGEQNADVATSMDAVGMALISQTKVVEAEIFFRKALAIRTQLLRPDDPAVAASLDNIGVLLQAQLKLPEAEKVHRQVLEIRRRLTGDESQLTEAMLHLSSALWRQRQRQKLPEAEALNAEALAILKKRFGDLHPALVTCLLNQGTVYRDEGKPKEAETNFLATIDLLKQLKAEESAPMAQTLNQLGMMISRQPGRMPEGEEMLRRALEIRRRVLGTHHEDFAQSLNDLAVVLQWKGSFAESEKLQREYLALEIELHGSNYLYVATAKNNLAWVLRDQLKFPEAEQFLREALDLQRTLNGATNASYARSLHNLGVICSDQRRFPQAVQAHRDALAVHLAVFTNDSSYVAGSQLILAAALCDDGQPAEAVPLARAALDLFQRKGPDTWDVYRAQAVLGRSLAGTNDNVEAERLLLSGCAGMEQRLKTVRTASWSSYTQALQSLIQLYEATARPEQAARWTRTLADFNKGQSQPAANEAGKTR